MKERFPVPPTPPLDEVMEGEIIPPGEFDPMLARRLVETMEMFPAEIQPMIREWAKDSVRAVLNPALDIIQSREGRVADIEDMINLAQSNRKRFLREVFFLCPDTEKRMEYETILRAQGVNVDFANPGEEIHERFSTFDSDQHQGHMEDITPRRGLLGGLGDTEQSLEKPPNRSFPRIKDL